VGATRTPPAAARLALHGFAPMTDEMAHPLRMRVFTQAGDLAWETSDGSSMRWEEVMLTLRRVRAEVLGPDSVLVGINLVSTQNSPDHPPNFEISGRESSLHQCRCGDTPALAGVVSVDLTLVCSWLHPLDVVQALSMMTALFEQDAVARACAGPVWARPVAPAQFADKLLRTPFASLEAVESLAILLLDRACQQGRPARLDESYLAVITDLKDLRWMDEAVDTTHANSFRRAVVNKLEEKFDALQRVMSHETLHSWASQSSSLDSARRSGHPRIYLAAMKGLVRCFARCFEAGFSSRIGLAKFAANLVEQWPRGTRPYAEGMAEDVLRSRACLRHAVVTCLQMLIEMTADKLQETQDGGNLLAELETAASHLADEAAVAITSDYDFP